MKDFETAVRNRTANQKSRCGVARIVREMTAEDAETLSRVLALPPEEAGTVAITSELNSAGFDISRKVVGLHRRGECACEQA